MAVRRCDRCHFWVALMDGSSRGECWASSPRYTPEPVVRIRLHEQLSDGTVIHHDDGEYPDAPWWAVLTTAGDHFCATWTAKSGGDKR